MTSGWRLLAQGRHAEAETAFEEALAGGASPAEAHHGLGALFLSQGRLEDAYDSLQLALHHDPDRSDVLADLSLVLAKGGDFDGARQAAVRAAHRPPSPRGWGSLGYAYKTMGEPAQAAGCYRRALELEPNASHLACQLGYVLFLGGDYGAAQAAYERALALAPDDPATLHNLGLLELETGFPDAALGRFEASCRTLAAPQTGACIGHALRDLGRHEEACEAYERVLRREPGFGDARINLAYALLMRGELAAGWAQYESRFEATGSPCPDGHGAPRWRGEPLGDSRLLVVSEQGIGDCIMFASCLPDLDRVAQQCAVECHPRLVPLLARSFPKMHVCAALGSREGEEPMQAPRCDFHIPIGSLPGFFRSSRDSFTGGAYLRADPVRVRRRRAGLARGGERLIGISWQGGALRTRRLLRSIPLAHWRQFLAVPGCRFVSLQHGSSGAELQEMARDGLEIASFPGLTENLDELAALVAAMDLVITVDNTVAHLAGALGVPAWVLLPFSAEWRWQLDRERSPWYSSLRLFRQLAPRDWAPVLHRVGAELTAFATHASTGPALE